MRVLMVCLGNICRSPLAEGILQYKARQAGLNWTVESAGTNSYHTGNAPHALSQKVANLNGIYIGDQKARTFEAADFHRYDKIYALAANVLTEMKRIAGKSYNSQKAGLLMNEAFADQHLDVPDPYYGNEQGYHGVYKMIGEACDSIVEKSLTMQPVSGSIFGTHLSNHQLVTYLNGKG